MFNALRYLITSFILFYFLFFKIFNSICLECHPNQSCSQDEIEPQTQKHSNSGILNINRMIAKGRQQIVYDSERQIFTLFKQYPAWNIIGGKIMLKNISGSNVAFRSISFCSTLTISPLKLYAYVLFGTGASVRLNKIKLLN